MTRILREGYALSFTKEPEPAFLNNNRSALNNREFITKEILDLLSSGRIREVGISEAHTINPLTIADNGEKLRLILDLRHIIQYLQFPKFKCEDIRLIQQLFNRSDFFSKFDIRSGYHHIDIHPAYQIFLAFAWSINGQVRYFVFTVLVFGFSSAPFVIIRDNSNNITTKLYDKRDTFGFHIVNSPFMSSNIPSAPAYGVHASQLIRYARCCSNYSDFLSCHRALVTRLLSQGYKVNRLSNTFKKFYGRHTGLVGQYKKSVCQMFANSIS